MHGEKKRKKLAHFLGKKQKKTTLLLVSLFEAEMCPK